MQKAAAPSAMAQGRSYNGDGAKAMQQLESYVSEPETKFPQSSIRAVDEYDRSTLALDRHHPHMEDIASHALSAGATERCLHTPARRRSRVMPNMSEVLKPGRAAAAPVMALPSRHEADRRSAVESWENEGGHFPEFAPIRNPSAAVPEPSATDSATQRAEIESLTRKLADDFANGRVGKRYSTYQHRARVIRQLTAIWNAGRH